jgi:beta-lactam-binding protein with PASTA domain
VLKDLGCKAKSGKAHSATVHKGNVIKTKPGPGRYTFGRTVKLVVSSGPKKHK